MSKDDWRINLEVPGQVCLAAEKDGKFVGMISGRLGSDGEASIGDMYVSEEARGQNVAKKIINDTIAALQKMDPKLQKITLTVYDDLKPAMGLYKSVGFEIVKSEPTVGTYQDRQLIEHTMELDLSKR